MLQIYCELCVISHYQEVMVGRGRVDDYLGTIVVRLPSIYSDKTLVGIVVLALTSLS